MKVVIAGSGRTLFHLCRSFAEKGHRVTVVNPDRDECERIARRLTADVILADAIEPDALAEAGADSAEVVIAMTPADEENLLICQTAAARFAVPRIVAIANDPENVEVFERFGITAVSTARIVSDLIERRATSGAIVNLIPLEEGKVNVAEVMIELNAPVVGKTLREIAMPVDSLIAVVIRNGRPIVPRGDHRIAAGDKIAVITLPDGHSKALKALTGELG